VGERKAAVVLAVKERACDGVKAQLTACGDITALERTVQTIQDEVGSSEDCVRDFFQGENSSSPDEESKSDKEEFLKERDRLRSRLHEALASLRRLVDKRGVVLQRSHEKILEDFMDMARRDENARLHALWRYSKFQATRSISSTRSCSRCLAASGSPRRLNWTGTSACGRLSCRNWIQTTRRL
jgi:hypothetical protein